MVLLEYVERGGEAGEVWESAYWVGMRDGGGDGGVMEVYAAARLARWIMAAMTIAQAKKCVCGGPRVAGERRMS